MIVSELIQLLQTQKPDAPVRLRVAAPGHDVRAKTNISVYKLPENRMEYVTIYGDDYDAPKP